MTNAQKANGWFGTYMDFEGVKWDYKCSIPPPPPPPPPVPPARNPAFDNRHDHEMEIYLWIAYLFGTLGIFGQPVLIIMGYGIYIYFGYVTVLNLLEVINDGLLFDDWTLFPLRRLGVGLTCITLAAIFCLIPGMGFITSILFGWIAIIDYYDYVYLISPFIDEIFGIETPSWSLRPPLPH